jgi:hypothetical protein
MEEHYYTGCQHSMHFVPNGHTQLFSVSQYNSYVIVVPCRTYSATSTPFLSQKIAAISFLAGNVCLNFFWLAWWMCAHPLLWLLFGFSIHKWNPCLIACYHTMWSRNSSPSLWFSAFRAHPSEFSESMLRKNCHSLACDNPVENNE